MGMLERQKMLDEKLRSLDRDYRFLVIFRTTHPDYLYTQFGPFDSVEEAYETRERFKMELRKKLGPQYMKVISKHEHSIGDVPIERAARAAINKAINEEYYPKSQNTET